MKCRFIWIFFSPFLIWGGSLSVEVSARSAILINAETGKVLYEKQAHLPAYPASTTKLATALFALDEKKALLSQEVTVSEEALRIRPNQPGGIYPPHWGDSEGTVMGLVRGEKITLEALLHGLLFISGNDAANVIAESLSLSIPSFAEEMNVYLQSMGCSSTRFQNPHGLHHPEHVTSAYDMALIAKKAFSLPLLKEVMGKTTYRYPKTKWRKNKHIVTSNPLLKPGKYFYPKAIGGKTGYHSMAKYTLVVAAEDDQRALIAVLLGCEKREDRYRDAIALFEAAFREEKKEKILFSSGTVWEKNVSGAMGTLLATTQKEASISFFPSEEPKCKASLHWKIPPLPIHKGAVVGTLQIAEEKNVLLEVPLLAKEDLFPTFWHRVVQFFSIRS